MAPEQALGEVDRLDDRCDVFGLGAILCEILTGAPPTGTATRPISAAGPPGDLVDAFARLESSAADAELITLTRECLAPEPGDRPRHAGVVADRMAAYLNGVQQRLHDAELVSARAQERAVEERKRRKVALCSPPRSWSWCWVQVVAAVVPARPVRAEGRAGQSGGRRSAAAGGRGTRCGRGVAGSDDAARTGDDADG